METAHDIFIAVDASSASVTITLPTALGIEGREYTIKKAGRSRNAVIVDGNGSETIDGAATYRLPAPWKYVTVVSDGTNWLIVGNN
jgi:hypothetical protein